MKFIDDKEWSRFIDEAMCFDGESNFNFDFITLTRKYGKAYIEYCKAAYMANGGCLTDDEFMKINGNMPKSFFDKMNKLS